MHPHSLTTRRVGIDVDGVLADLLTPLLTIASELLQREVYVSHLQSWDLDDLFLGDDAALLPELWRRAGAPGFCRDLRPYEGAVEGVAALREAGADIFVVTSPLHDAPTWTHDREHWLREHFQIHRHHINHVHEKYTFAGGMLVDDKPENIERWAAEHEGVAVLWDQPWNAQHVFRHETRAEVRRTSVWDAVLFDWRWMQDENQREWRKESLSSSEVWAVRELISVCDRPTQVEEKTWEPTSREASKALYLIHKCEKNGVPVERCRRLLDILDLDSDFTNERLVRYHAAR